jgi:hypothetical protein
MTIVTVATIYPPHTEGRYTRLYAAQRQVILLAGQGRPAVAVRTWANGRARVLFARGVNPEWVQGNKALLKQLWTLCR